jgi:hypothetical protein
LSWQEELRRLDEELADGRISADDYRLRRDIVLSSAVNPELQTPPAASGQAESTQIIAPVGEGQRPPTPPGGQPQQQQPPASADRTQVVNNAAVADGAERTQVTSGNWQANWTGDAAGDADRTQVVSGVPPQAVSGAFRPAPGSEQGPRSGDFPAQQQYQPTWNTPSSDTSTPWGGPEFPPLAPPTNHDWVGQGPEAFETTSSGGKKKVIGIVIAVVVVAALAVGGFFIFGNKSDTTAQPTTPTSSVTPPPPPRPKDDLEIAALPGTVAEIANFNTFGEVEARQVLTPEENEVYKTAGAAKSRLAVSSLPSNVNVVVLTSETSSPDAAVTARDALVDLQIKYKMETYTGEAPGGVKVVQLDASGGGKALIRAHYVHKNTVVRIHVEGSDLASISKVFDEILATQLQDLPVGN